jgi:membrane associated rhomboid family serine protease
VRRAGGLSDIPISFGPGPITPAVRAIIIANVAVFLVTLLTPGFWIEQIAGLTPADVLERGFFWQPVTYLFVHDSQSLFHILFNMLAVWMFGVDLERRWGTTAFTKYYFVCGVGAGATVILASLLPISGAAVSYGIPTIGASGAVFGILLAWGVVFPERQVLFMMLFPLRARMLVIIYGTIAFISAVASSGGGISHWAHLGGLAAGWIYLRGPRNFRLDWQYRLTKWRMARMRRKFNIHRGGRDDWEQKIH